MLRGDGLAEHILRVGNQLFIAMSYEDKVNLGLVVATVEGDKWDRGFWNFTFK